MKHIHKGLFVILIVFSVMLSGLFYYFRGLPDKQFTVAIAAAAAYFFWGILYHKAKRDFHLKIMIEYFLIAIIALFLVRGALF